MESVIQHINKGWKTLLRLSPLMLCIIWLTTSNDKANSTIALIICAIATSMYFICLLVKQRSKMWYVSEGALILVISQLGILTYVLITFFGISMSDLSKENLPIVLVLLFVAIAIFRAFVFVRNYESPVDVIEPTVNGEDITSEGAAIIAALDGSKNKRRESLTLACTFIMKDYLDSLISSPIIHNDKKVIISKYIPSKAQILEYPTESLVLLLSSQSYIQHNITEDPYCNFNTNLDIINAKLKSNI